LFYYGYAHTVVEMASLVALTTLVFCRKLKTSD
jgi:hypothetical protein